MDFGFCLSWSAVLGVVATDDISLFNASSNSYGGIIYLIHVCRNYHCIATCSLTCISTGTLFSSILHAQRIKDYWGVLVKQCGQNIASNLTYLLFPSFISSHTHASAMHMQLMSVHVQYYTVLLLKIRHEKILLELHLIFRSTFQLGTHSIPIYSIYT